MKKSMYSLILSDGVVAEIDRLAYKSNTNRSNMINQILAEYVSYVTPEKRMSQIFKQLEDIFSPSETFQTLLGNSVSVLNLRSSLDFKYNPSVRYSVELYRTSSNEVGQLKVYMRTQNSTLIYYMVEFFKLWTLIESKYTKDIRYTLDNAKFCRSLILHTQSGITTDKLGELIADYIKIFDKSLKIYFACIDTNISPNDEIERIYVDYLKKCEIII
ncbi:MAG: hypothetical protein IJZ93_03490 [Clostridia bacterium]|nr:hypothetical protein [Clostridia bacterium]